VNAAGTAGTVPAGQGRFISVRTATAADPKDP
jgi:hypothetical protein